MIVDMPGDDAPRRKTVVVEGLTIGGPALTWWCGPCAVESPDQISETADYLGQCGVHVLRGGAFKPRTSPLSFQGLGEPALHWLARAGRRYGLLTVSEALDVCHVDMVASCVDIVQIGARGMHNSALLKAVGRCGRPVLLKRSWGATIEEWLLAAEYLVREGNDRIVLCERGIRTFETWTRNTLDLSSVPLAGRMSGRPVIVDISHALGRTDIAPELARAALAVGCDGLMVEVHPRPEQALSDGRQSLTKEEFGRLMDYVAPVKRLLEREREAAAMAAAADGGGLSG